MKVLAISASPRKGGNSDVLCDRFLKGAAESGHEIEKIRLAEKRLTPCTACYGCMKTGECVKKDALPEIREKMLAADMIGMATPVYFYSMAAQMKILIDRCLGFYQQLAGKRFYFIVTAAEPRHEAADETIAGLRGFLRCMSSLEQIQDNISFMKDFQSLNETELAAVNRVREIFKSMNLIPCTACRYCTDGCPKQIRIPDLFAVMNTKQLYHDWNADYYYNVVHTSAGHKASDCIKCGKCEKACPQHLPIRELLVRVAGEFER